MVCSLIRHHMDNDTLHKIRESLNHEWVLGRSHFKDKFEEITNRQTRIGQAGKPRIEDEEGVYWVGYYYIRGNCSLTRFLNLVRKVKAAQYVANHDGEVCPAAREEGQETLTPGLDLVGKI